MQAAANASAVFQHLQKALPSLASLVQTIFVCDESDTLLLPVYVAPLMKPVPRVVFDASALEGVVRVGDFSRAESAILHHEGGHATSSDLGMANGAGLVIHN